MGIFLDFEELFICSLIVHDEQDLISNLIRSVLSVLSLYFKGSYRRAVCLYLDVKCNKNS